MNHHLECNDIIDGILNFNIPLPLSYYSGVWYYKHGNTESIRKAVSTFDWSKAFLHRNTNEKCKIMANILLNVF